MLQSHGPRQQIDKKKKQKKKTEERAITTSHKAYAKNPHALHSTNAYRFFLFFFSSCEQKENRPGNLFLKKNQTQFKET